jgi:serine phosphatase RsbU (regulator of sigma subunit)
VCEKIRENPEVSSIPVIHVSATAITSADRAEGLMRGADAYLTEPWEPSDLLATITALVRRTDLRRRILLTAARLRALNSAVADVHAASDDGQVLIAAVAGAHAISCVGAALVFLEGDRGVVLRVDSGGLHTRESVPAEHIEKALEPARTGGTVLSVDLAGVVAEPHVGSPFVDETGEPVGAILVPVRTEDVHEEALGLLAQLALAITLARANLSALKMEHRIAVVLQHSLLPQAPPRVEGVNIAFRYLAASPQAEVGGDFYDAFEIDDHHVAFAVGDVVGHSLHAATIMGELRHAIRCYGVDGHGPSAVLERVDRLITRFHPHQFTTVIYGSLDRLTGLATFCNAGHLPPLLLTGSDGQFLDGHGTLLGLGTSPPPEQHVQLASGDRLIFITDGLVERRNETIDIGLERVREVGLLTRGLSLDRVIDRLVTDVGPRDAPQDDIAILAIDFTGIRNLSDH